MSQKAKRATARQTASERRLQDRQRATATSSGQDDGQVSDQDEARDRNMDLLLRAFKKHLEQKDAEAS